MRLKHRPLAVTGFTVLLVLFVSIFVDGRAALAAIAGGAILCILCVSVKSLRKNAMLYFLAAALFLGGTLFTVENGYGLKYAESFTENESSDVTGYITDFPEYSGSRYYYIVETESIDGSPIKVNLRLSLPYELEAEPFDKISAQLKLYMVGRSAGADIERYFNSKEIFLGAYCSESDGGNISVEAVQNKPLRYKIILLRKELEERILKKLPNEYGGTAVGLLLGDKSYISDETKNDIYDAGVAPIFAVSGLHLSVWVFGLYEVLSQLKVRRRINSVICISFTLFFIALTGFTASVCRSGLMMILFLAGNLFYRRTDSVNSLGFAALVLCIVNPFIVADTGFLMSFSATLGIVTLLPYFEKILVKKIRFSLVRAVISAMLVSIIAVVSSLPVTVFSFGYISIFTLISNLLITYAATLCMFFAGLTAVLYPIASFSDVTAVITGILAKYILSVVHFFGGFPVSCISTADTFWKVGVVFCLAVLGFALVFFSGSLSRRFASIGMAAVTVVTALCSVLWYDGLTEVRVLDVGDGIAVVVSNGERKILLKGADKSHNSFYTVEDTLNYINRRNTNLMLIGNGDAAESSSTLQLLKEYGFVKVVMPYESITVSQLVDTESIIVSRKADLDVWSGGNVKFYCGEDVSFAFCEFDTKTFLVLFDARKGSEIPEEYAAADFLVCGGYIPENLDISSFSAVFISSGEKKSESVSGYVERNGGRAFEVRDLDELTVRIRNGEYKIYV